MTTPEKMYAELLSEQHLAVRNKMDILLATMVCDSPTQKQEVARSLSELLSKLFALVPQKMWPNWLTQLRSATEQFAEGMLPAEDYVKRLVQYFPAVQGHKWFSNAQGDGLHEFDTFFNKYRDESKLPELFEKIINIIKKIIATNAIDSRAVTEALNNLLRTLERNQKGSFLSLVLTERFLSVYCKNFLFSVLGKIPILGDLTTALKETVAEISSETKIVTDNVKADLSDIFESEVIEYSARSGLPALGFDGETANGADITQPSEEVESG